MNPPPSPWRRERLRARGITTGAEPSPRAPRERPAPRTAGAAPRPGAKRPRDEATAGRPMAEAPAWYDREVFERGALTHPTVPQAADGVQSFFVEHQGMLRDPKRMRVHGQLRYGEELLFDRLGEPVQVDAALLRAGGLEQSLYLHDGTLTLSGMVLRSGLRRADLARLSGDLAGATSSGLGVHLHHAGEARSGGELHLRRREELDQVALAHRPASATHLQLGRGKELVPGTAMTFHGYLDAMCAAAGSGDAEQLRALNARLYDVFSDARRRGQVAGDMSFQDYKLQFIDLTTPGVREPGLFVARREGRVTAADWAAAWLLASDLPAERRHPVWVSLEWTDGGQARDATLCVPCRDDISALSLRDPRLRAAVERELEREGWSTRGLRIEVLDKDAPIPGRAALMPKIEGFSAAQCAALLADPGGRAIDPLGGPPPSSEAALGKTTVAYVTRRVLTAHLAEVERLGARAVRDLLHRGVPHTQKVFLRQSNGVAGAVTLGGETIGQAGVVRQGNDTGAFGKCAPTAYFCASICGIAVAARAGLEALERAGGTVADDARELRGLITRVPMDGATRAAIRFRLAALGAAGADRGALKAIEQLVASITDRIVSGADEQGPYLEMRFFAPSAASDPYIGASPPRGWKAGPRTVRLRPEQIQEYLEQTGRFDGYRGLRQHMMDFYKDPSALDALALRSGLGVGLIAAGVDRALKELGKADGLLYGPGPEVVGAMVYGRPVKAHCVDLTSPTPRKDLLALLERASAAGGAAAVSMGYSEANGHVNYVIDWGTPRIAGVPIDAKDLARCHMNRSENSATTSAWVNDRVLGAQILDPARMARGLEGIERRLRAAGAGERAAEIAALRAEAQGIRGGAAKQLDAVRALAAKVMGYFEDHLQLARGAGRDDANVVLMASNTERDDFVSDNAGDAALRRDGGVVNPQALGSANAADGAYFVPLDCLAAGWDAPKPEDATAYRGHDEPFIMLSSLEVILPR